MSLVLPDGVVVKGPVRAGYEQVLTREAVAFVADLERRFGSTVTDLLARRVARPSSMPWR